MKSGMDLIVLLLLLCTSCRAQQTAFREALTSALRWHFRWIQELPSEKESIDCSLAVYENGSFAHCGSVSLSMDIANSRSRQPRIASMVHEHVSFDKALADFRAHRNRDGRQLGSVQLISVPTSALADCMIDWQRTENAVRTAIAGEQKGKLENDGFTFRYPLVCAGDPFYLLYFLKGETVSWIWQFEISPDRLELVWSYDAGTEQRKLPKKAVDNLRKPELWYKPTF